MSELACEELIEQDAQALRSALQKPLEELQSWWFRRTSNGSRYSSRELETLMQLQISRLESLISGHSDAVVQRAMTITPPIHQACE